MTRVKSFQNYRLSLILITYFLFSYQSHAQESIATARPTLSVGPWVLPENSFQWEQGAFYADETQGDNYFYDAFFRASISKSSEIRILIPTLRSKFAVVGWKWMMIQPEGRKAGVGFSVSMRSDGNSLRVAGYRVAANKRLSDNLVGFINVGKAGNGYFGDVTLALGLSDRITLMGEYWHHEEWQQLQSGITFLINSETQIDLNYGLLFNASSNYTIGIGFARRFKMNYTRDDA